jgi:hypothetical protein
MKMLPPQDGGYVIFFICDAGQALLRLYSKKNQVWDFYSAYPALIGGSLCFERRACYPGGKTAQCSGTATFCSWKLRQLWVCVNAYPTLMGGSLCFERRGCYPGKTADSQPQWTLKYCYFSQWKKTANQNETKTRLRLVLLLTPSMLHLLRSFVKEVTFVLSFCLRILAWTVTEHAQRRQRSLPVVSRLFALRKWKLDIDYE